MCVFLDAESLRQSPLFKIAVLPLYHKASKYRAALAIFCFLASAAGISNLPAWFLHGERAWHLPAKGGRAR